MAIARIVRMNLQALLDAAKDAVARGQTPVGPPTILELEAATGVGRTTIYRILDPEADYLLTLTTLVKLANVYELPVWQFLYPNLDPLHPPHCLTQEEREQHEEWHAVYLQVQAIARGTNTDNTRAAGTRSNDSDTGGDSGAESSPRRPKYPRP